MSSPGRGRFAITETGRALLARRPVRIDTALLETSSPAFREFYRGEGTVETAEVAVVPAKGGDVVGATPDEHVDAAYATLMKALRADLLERILQNTPAFFEQVIVDLLVAMGYGGSHSNAAAQLGRSGDGGVDGVINEDRLGLDRVYVQAKRYAPGNAVGRPEVQAFVGSLVGLGASKGVFVTTSGFSGQAREYAQRLPQRVILIDGQVLAELMIEHDVGVRVYKALAFKRLDEDFFAGEG